MQLGLDQIQILVVEFAGSGIPPSRFDQQNHSGQRIADLMGDAGGELTDRGEAFGTAARSRSRSWSLETACSTR